MDSALVAKLNAEKAADEAQQEVAAVRADSVAAREAEAEAKRELMTVRVRAQEAMREVQILRGNGSIKRDVVMETLVAMIQARRPKEALSAATT
jgi:hypothetical protein